MSGDGLENSLDTLNNDSDDVEQGEDDQRKVDDGGETEERGILELAGEKEVEATREGVEGRDGETLDDEWETAEEEDEDDEDEEQDGEIKQDENGERGEQRAEALAGERVKERDVGQRRRGRRRVASWHHRVSARLRRRHHHSDNEDDDNISVARNNVDVNLDHWLTSELQPLSLPSWCVVPALRLREVAGPGRDLRLWAKFRFDLSPSYKTEYQPASCSEQESKLGLESEQRIDLVPGSVSGSEPVPGSLSVSEPVPLSLSGPEPVLLSGSGPELVLLSGSGPEPVLLSGSGPESVLLSGSGPESVLLSGSGPEPVLLSGSGPEPVLLSGSGLEPVPLSGSGLEPVPLSGSGLEPVPLSGSGLEPVPLAGSGLEPVPLAGSGLEPVPLSGSEPVPLSGSEPVPLSGSEPVPLSGSVPVPLSGSEPVPVPGFGSVFEPVPESGSKLVLKCGAEPEPVLRPGSKLVPPFISEPGMPPSIEQQPSLGHDMKSVLLVKPGSEAESKTRIESESRSQKRLDLQQEVNVQSTHRMRYRTRLQSCWTCSAATAAPFRHAALSSRSFASRLVLTTHLEGHSGCVNALGWDASGQRLVSGGDDLSVILWDWSRSRTLLRYDSKHRANVFQTKFLPPPGDSTIVTCARDGQVRAGHLSTAGGPPPTRRLVQHRGAAHKLALYPDSPCCFVSAGEDGQVYGLDLRQDKPSSRLTVTREGKRVALYTVHINPARPTEIAVGGRDRYALVFDQRTIGDSTWEPVTELCPKHLVASSQPKVITCLVYSPDGQELLLSYNDDDIFLCDVHHGDGSYNRRFKGHRNNATVKGVNFMGSGGEFVVSGSDCGHLFVWDKESAQILLALPGDTGGVLNCLEPHPHAPLLATSGLDPDVKLWSPTATGLPDLSQLSEVLKRNKRERDEESHEPAGPFNSHMLWLLMQQLRHRSSRTDPDVTVDSESSSQSDDSDDEEDYDGEWERVQCAPS